METTGVVEALLGRRGSSPQICLVVLIRAASTSTGVMTSGGLSAGNRIGRGWRIVRGHRRGEGHPCLGCEGAGSRMAFFS
jgi:hypothetical protein